ncbi:MAG: phage tail tube protein [bacterium]|nr:phage tail tube protein [bacterium]
MPKILRYLGLAEETEFAQAENAEFHVDIASASLDAPGDTNLEFEGSMGRGARLHRPGFYSPSGNIVYAFDIKTIRWLLKWALGGYVFTGAEDLHEIYASDGTNLPSFTARLGKDVFEHVFVGCKINSLEIQVEDSFCQATADIVAVKDSKATLKEQHELILPEDYPLAFHEVTAKLNNGDKSADIKGFTLTITNGFDASAGRSIGSRYPRKLLASNREVTLTANMFFEGTEELERYWGGETGPSDTGSTEYSLEFNFDAGNGKGMVILMPRVIHTNVDLQPSGRDELVQVISAKAYMDSLTLNDGTTEIATDVYVSLVDVDQEGGEG